MKKKTVNLYNEDKEEQVIHNLELDKSYNKRLILVFCIIFLSLLLLGLGIVYYFYKADLESTSREIEIHDVYVVHSKTEFGSTIDKLGAYNSYDNSYKYTFYVDNQNDVTVSYKVSLIDVGSVNFDKSNIKYAILKNQEVAFKGILNNDKENVILTTELNSNSIDNYEIRFWTDDKTLNDNYGFKVKIYI